MATDDAEFVLDDEGSDIEELQEAADRITADASPERPEYPDSTAGPVRLPGGYRRIFTTSQGTKIEKVDRAWVQELTGEDEEVIAQARQHEDPVGWFEAILMGGISRLGDGKPSRDDFREMLSGDREFLMLHVAIATFGDELTFEEVICRGCGASLDVTITPSEDIPVKTLDKPEDADFTVELSRGREALVTLPTASTMDEMQQMMTAAELNTVLIANCVSEIKDGNKTIVINGDEDAAKRLSIRDRAKIVKEIGDRVPGPRYNEVRFEHPACGKEVLLPVTLQSLFRGL